jgi:hypothetical protein
MPQGPDHWQGARYRVGQTEGHYESWFLRGNHPVRNEAFWIRYTIFSPEGRPQAAVGEVWAIHFDGEAKTIRAAKDELPICEARFSPHGLDVVIGQSTLGADALQGSASRPHRIAWDLCYDGGSPPVVFLPERLYDRRLPKAKAVTPRPNVVFKGTLSVDGAPLRIDDWVGSANHNWGRRHTDSYAWGQVCGFDDAPDAFLECTTARLKFGPLWTPPLTIAVLRVGEENFRFNALPTAFRADAAWDFFDWRFDTAQDGLRLHGRIRAAREDFVGLTYSNPPGGSHTCLNSKIAACELTLERPGGSPLLLATKRRAAFEILTDRTDHGVPVVA